MGVGVGVGVGVGIATRRDAMLAFLVPRLPRGLRLV